MHFDPLRDEGIAYALGMLTAGVTVELHLFSGTFHRSAVIQHAAISQREQAEATAVLGNADRRRGAIGPDRRGPPGPLGISMTQDKHMARGRVHTAVADLLERTIDDE